eukprot:TRINITY_DN3564_c0_g1_i3.p1 TRINITY_DN3564_c0_g1~~TRINITY_DN3564_c0_g1_i3.p1  ORF type:complete len:139 (-),score=17.23 TRINITY_DN3564_c0_g1_i3:19-435(-)
MKKTFKIFSGRVVIPKSKVNRKAAIEITESAANRLKYKISQCSPETKGVRLGVKTRGCNGLSYTMDYISKIEKFDEHVQDKGIDIYIDPRALMYVIGTKMDYLEGDLSSEFIFENPNAENSCGCGESFSPNIDIVKKN